MNVPVTFVLFNNSIFPLLKLCILFALIVYVVGSTMDCKAATAAVLSAALFTPPSFVAVLKIGTIFNTTFLSSSAIVFGRLLKSNFK